MASARARKAEEGKRMDENATDNDPLIPRSNEDDDDSGLLSLLLRDARNDAKKQQQARMMHGISLLFACNDMLTSWLMYYR